MRLCWRDRQYLRAWYGRVETELLAEAMEMTPLEVCQAAREEGLLDGVALRRGMPWTAPEIEELRRRYLLGESSVLIGRVLRRSGIAVRRKVRALGLLLPTEIRSDRARRRFIEEWDRRRRYSEVTLAQHAATLREDP